MRCVVIESPYAGDVERNLAYARACMADSIARGEAPYASHLLYTQEGVLDDQIPEDRARGIEAGYLWMAVAELVVFYVDYGISSSMIAAAKIALVLCKPIRVRECSSVCAKTPALCQRTTSASDCHSTGSCFFLEGHVGACGMPRDLLGVGYGVDGEDRSWRTSGRLAPADAPKVYPCGHRRRPGAVVCSCGGAAHRG